MTTGTVKNNEGAGTTLRFEDIGEPGCYVCNWSGHLLRVPQDAVHEAQSPTMSVVGCDPLMVTKIATDPFTSLTKARMVASNLDVHVNF